MSVERFEFAGGAQLVQGIAQRNGAVEQVPQHNRCPGEQDRSLQHIGPDHRLEAADHGVAQHKRRDDQDAGVDVDAGDEGGYDRRRHHDRGGRDDLRKHEDEREDGTRGYPEAMFEVLIDRRRTAVVEEGQQDGNYSEHYERVVHVDRKGRHAIAVGPCRSAEKR